MYKEEEGRACGLIAGKKVVGSILGPVCETFVRPLCVGVGSLQQLRRLPALHRCALEVNWQL